jgi:hypothetical protein
MRYRGSTGAARVESLGDLSGGAPPRTANPVNQALNVILAAPITQPTGPRPSDDVYLQNPDEYFRICAAQSDWQGLARYYATQINERLKGGSHASSFWDISQKNVREAMGRPLTAGDLHGFLLYCVKPMVVNDLGSQVGFGTKEAWLPTRTTKMAWNRTTMQECVQGVAKGGDWDLSLGWVQEPDSNLVGNIFMGIVLAVVTFGAATAIAGAFAATSAAGAGTVTGAAGAGTGAGALTAGGVAGAAAAPVIETVVVTATAPAIISAGTIAAAAGSGVVAGAIVANTAPGAIQAPTIENVVVTGSAPIAAPVAAGSVASGLSAGVLVATAAPPVFEAPPLEVPEGTIENVTVEGSPLSAPPLIPLDVLASLLSSLAPITLTPQTINAPKPELKEQSLEDKIKDHLKDAAKKYGQQYLEDYLAKLLAEKLGRAATPDELDYYQDWIDDGLRDRPKGVIGALSTYWPIILLVSIAAVVALKRKRK